MPATTKKDVQPSNTIEYQRQVINDMAGDLHSLFVGTAAINAATIQVAGADIGSISDHIDKTIFFYYGGFTVDTTLASPQKLAELYTHVDATVDIDDGVTLTIDDQCSMGVSNTTSYKFISNDTEQTNIQKLTGFADNTKLAVSKDMAMDGKKKVGYFLYPDWTDGVTNQFFTPTAADYNQATGDLTLTVGSHAVTLGDKIKISPNSLVFTCTKDSNATNHAYPRTTDTTAYNKQLSVTGITTTGFTVNVGVSPDLKKTVTTASYTPTTGVLVLTVNGHGLTTSDKIRIADGSLTFRCAKDSNQTLHIYPRSTDPASGKDLDIASVTTDTITVNVGISSDTSTHTFVSAVANGISHKNQYAHTFVSADALSVQLVGTYDDTPVDVDDTFTLTVDDGAVVIV